MGKRSGRWHEKVEHFNWKLRKKGNEAKIVLRNDG